MIANGAGAVLIQGAKGCGKTETAAQLAKSAARLDVDDDIRVRMELDPKSALAGPVPRLIDEWQEYPQIWNYIRREVDDRKVKGQFILTGSIPARGAFPSALVKGRAPKSEQTEFDLKTLAEKLTLGGF
jgi:serine kinase of HPr protein (carbohydrate metabolism regulator)